MLLILDCEFFGSSQPSRVQRLNLPSLMLFLFWSIYLCNKDFLSVSEQRCVCVIDTISVFVLSVRARTSVFVWHLYIFCIRRLVGIRSYIFCGCLPFCDFLRSSSLSKLLGCQSANHCHICWPSSARFVRTMDITHHRFGICICIFGLSTAECVRIIDISRRCI